MPSLGIREYKDSNWTQCEVREPKDTPMSSHYAAGLFDTYLADSGYSVAEGGGSYKVCYLRYYAFPNNEELEKWMAEASQAKKDFFVFGAKMGSPKAVVTMSSGVEL